MSSAIRSVQSKAIALAPPGKVKGTLLKKWADYWKNLVIDYRQMLRDLRTDVQDDPQKAIKWTVGLGIGALLFKNNPSEIDFKANLKCIENEMILVHEDCLKSSSVDHVRYLQSSYNQDKLHYRSFGFLSIMYTTDYNVGCGLYKSQCSYLKPSFFNWFSRIVDVGFMGRWWNIYIKTTDYDINY